MSTRDGLRRLTRGSLSLGTIVLAAVIPKCPICVAAALAAVGVGTSVGLSVAPIVRPIGVAVAIATLVFVVWSEWQRRSRRSCVAACAKAGANDAATD